MINLMVKLFSWRKDANKEKRWGKRWTYTFYLRKADRDAAMAARALLDQPAENDSREN